MPLVWIALFMGTCSPGGLDPGKGWWKYGEGYHAGDVVHFSEGYSLSGDTLVRNGQRIGIITSRTYNLFGSDRMEIVSMDGKQKGVYYQK